MKHTGWRKPTPGLGIAEQLAQAGERVAVPKTRAFVAVKRVGAYIGLKAGDMMLLDTLGAFTQAQDWEEGQRPIVWASNAYLMEQTGFSLSALKRHARRLAEIGVISFQDSPNGKRWGRRDADGRIIEAYGFDLSPLSARVEEFEELHAELQAERELCQRLKRQITVARRMIRARIDAAVSSALRGPWTQFTSLFKELLDRLPRRHEASEQLARLLTWFKELQERVEAAYLKATEAAQPVENTSETKEQVLKKPQKTNPREVISDPHILITNQLNPVTSNSSEHEEVAAVVPNAQLEEWVAEVRKKRAALDLPTVMQACPEFASWARNMGGFLKDWGDLHRVAGQLRPMIGVSEHAWNVAQERLGKQVATAALALVFEKHCAGEVSSPGGYLRGMVEKAGAGELHLERSFYGRLSGQAA
ncbi:MULTISPECIES: plasmid replication protein RepC [Roseobacteraceae]|jgi:replication initiation protein RepC|uniref:Replication initiation protein RepC n=1 Tax=Celeribacter baekdonensis TaxID=875171 RepID=A0A1G7T4T5_9RHOB|nr:MULTISPECIES: plasmid replication protein RepC [Roseobacteraceae]MBU0642229.1 replication protein C [Alphaproteobacteria bacterium]AVW90029.1 replication protein C [Celeribacter baekdonensis]KAB6714381.1 replication protein C [Roseobacter sp. TSBP12]MBU1280667.1 replication protein C [Alphaproteobacteria bacterium]MBU1830731.1 replication protein C [Alphaproteobacteria bacterium]|tara:strand:- start:5413 stop:6669 length:1257 start_codon:yes stop_codon:yes gene_type:complete